MDIEKSSRAPIAFRQSCRAALYTILVLISPFIGILAIAAIVAFYRELRMMAGCCFSAAAILALVRWLNRREVPRLDRFIEMADAVAITVIPWWILAVIVLATWPRIPQIAADVLTDFGRAMHQ
jgi:hypothetical protein